MIDPILYQPLRDRKRPLTPPPLTVSKPGLHPLDRALMRVLEVAGIMATGALVLMAACGVFR